MADAAAVAEIPTYAAQGDESGAKFKEYQALYNYSITRPAEFWGKEAIERLTWVKPFDTVKSGCLKDGDGAWFTGGQINTAYNCLDRHNPDNIAIVWEGNDVHEIRHITYGELTQMTCRIANALKTQGAKKGDSIVIYMPMVPEAAAMMLACARIGAVHSVVFAGFSAEALRARIDDAGSNIIFTSDFGLRGPKRIGLKKIVDDALALPGPCTIKKCICFQRLDGSCPWNEGMDLWLHDVMAAERPYCPCEALDAEDPLFLMYTSGSTGKPKGILHTQAGYLLLAQMTFEHVFGYKPGDMYACVADIGWITGHSYIVYGPLSLGAKTLMFESIPTYPDAGRYWDMVQRHKINQFYTAPTAIRALQRYGDEFPKKYDLSSLRTLGTVGEPINPEAWNWYYNVIGGGKCDIVDTYWQTETGAHVVTPLAGVTPQKPGAAMAPFFGIELCLIDPDSATGEGGLKELEGPDQSGILCIKQTWPSMVRTIQGDHARFMDTYLNPYPGYYFAGDGAIRDKDGFYWITGRVDDVLNVSGHRLGTAEIESALATHDGVAESAVVGVPHEVKGVGIFAYVILKPGVDAADPELKTSLKGAVRKMIGGIASPDHICIAPGLPKTRSGKIMRRILRKIAGGERDISALGDISTLANPEIPAELIATVEKM